MLSTFNPSQPFLDSFSAERPDFQGYSSDFEESVVSQDYWKLVKNENGQFKWEEDGQTAFDLSAIGLGEHISPEAMEVFLNSMSDTSLESLDYDDIKHFSQEERLAIMTADLGISKDLRFNDFSMRMGVSQTLGKNNFLEGTLAFVDSSMKIDEAIDYIDGSNFATNPIDEVRAQNLLTSMFQSFDNIETTGLLQKHQQDIIDTSNLVNLSSVPGQPLYVPVELGPGQETHESSSDPGDRLLSIARGITQHGGIDLRGIWDSNVVASTNNSAAVLQYDSVYGLNVNNTLPFDGITYGNRLSHLEGESTIMAFLNLFGTSGIDYGGGRFDNIQAGTILGNVGNTGSSGGDHLHWDTYADGRKISPLDSIFYGNYLTNDITRTDEASFLSNMGTNDIYSPTAAESFSGYWDKTGDVDFIWELFSEHGMLF